jgi:predicted O-methyltransferase YrrM
VCLVAELKQTYVDILQYLNENLSDAPIYEWVLAETAARGLPQIQITAAQGRFLRLLVSLLRARRVLEVGTLCGYSTLWMAHALPSGGRLITLEANEQHAQLAREAFARAGVADRIELLVGPALESLAKLELDASLDLMFIDADKSNNRRYFDWAMQHVRPGGLVVVDNVLANGRVCDGQKAGAYARSISEFNDYVFAHYAEQATVIPFYKQEEDNLDGILIVQMPETSRVGDGRVS